MTFHETEALDAYRPGYLPEFFVEAARRLALKGHESLLDIGCGWGDVALGLAPHVGSMTGLDPEMPSLLSFVARARAAGYDARIVHAPAESADPTLGPFDVITIGRALWYLKPEAVLPRLDRWLKPGGRIVVCSTGESEFGGAIWDEVFLLLIERWKRFPLPTRSWTPQDFFRDSLFAPAGRIEAYGEWRIDLDSVVKRFFGMPQTSTAALGADAPRAERDVRALLGRFFKNGPLTERLHTAGDIFKRRDDP